MEVTYLDECYISGRWGLHIWAGVTYLDDGGYISGRVLHIWTMEVTYLGGCYISGRWRLHIWAGVTYLDDGGYISGRVLQIWTMEVTYLGGCYISGRLHIYARHMCVPVYMHMVHMKSNCSLKSWRHKRWALWTQIYKRRDFFMCQYLTISLTYNYFRLGERELIDVICIGFVNLVDNVHGKMRLALGPDQYKYVVLPV